jgi:hypothetical protein
MVKIKTYAPPKGDLGANNVELSEESDADLLGLPDDTPSISGINTIPPLSNGPRRSLRLRQKGQANQTKGKAVPTHELNVESKGDSTGIYGMLKGAMQDMKSQVVSAAVQGIFSTVGSKPKKDNKN